MKTIRNLSISTKLTLIILLVTFFALLSGLILYMISAVNQQKNDFTNSMVVNANLIGEYSIGPIMFDDKRGGTDILNKLKGIPEIQTAYIFDSTGNIFSSYNTDKVKVNGFPAFSKDESVAFGSSVMEIYEPITLAGEYYGTIYLNVSTNVLESKIKEQFLLLVGVSAGILLLSWVFAHRIQVLISKPLLRLTDAAKRVSADNDYSVRVNKKNNDEIGILYDQFNEMVKQIESRQAQQKANEAAIKKSVEKYRNLYENSQVGIYRTDVETGRLLEANDAAYRILGLKHGSKIEMSKLYINSNERSKIKSIALENGYIDNYEVKLKRPDNKVIWVSISGKLFDNNQYFEGVIHDITESKENFINLKKANFELDSFVYHASHDLRSPLLSILGLVNLSKYETDPEKLHEFMAMIKKSIQKLDALIADLLVLSRDNRIDDAIQTIDVEKQVKECISNYDFLKGFSKIDITVNVEADYTFVSDLTRLTIILNNLLSNAIKYHRKDIANPFINVSVVIKERTCEIIVEDNGEGISKDDLPKIFDMFYRATQNSEGSGLGLYIVKNVIDKLDGSIKIESKEGEGTRSIIILPNHASSHKLIPSKTTIN
ncbi:MAG: ATP-binding protein [Fulvivirga sp.]